MSEHRKSTKNDARSRESISRDDLTDDDLKKRTQIQYPGQLSPSSESVVKDTRNQDIFQKMSSSQTPSTKISENQISGTFNQLDDDTERAHFNYPQSLITTDNNKYSTDFFSTAIKKSSSKIKLLMAQSVSDADTQSMPRLNQNQSYGGLENAQYDYEHLKRSMENTIQENAQTKSSSVMVEDKSLNQIPQDYLVETKSTSSKQSVQESQSRKSKQNEISAPASQTDMGAKGAPTVREYSQEILRHTYGSIHSKISKLSQQFLSSMHSAEKATSEKQSSQLVNNSDSISERNSDDANLGESSVQRKSSLYITESDRQASLFIQQMEHMNVTDGNNIVMRIEEDNNKYFRDTVSLSEYNATNITVLGELLSTGSGMVNASCSKKPSDVQEEEPLVTKSNQNIDQVNISTQSMKKIKSQQESSQKVDVFKQISDIIQSKEVPDKLSKKGEMICYLFKQRLFAKLEASGKLDEISAENASEMAAKFAKWVEDIMKEVEGRKKSVSKLRRSSHDTRTIESEDVFISATTSRESVTLRKDAIDMELEDDKLEVVKIHELSEPELYEKYGPLLLDRSKCEVFQFMTHDNRPVEVTHLQSDSNMKVMVVKKKNSDAQWSNWIVEVGPEVLLDKTTSKESTGTVLLSPQSNQSLNQAAVNPSNDQGRGPAQEKEKDLERDKEVKFGTKMITRGGEWTWETVGRLRNKYDFWKRYFPDLNAYGKMPILKRQCVLQPSDLLVEYPPYTPTFSGTIGGKRSVLEDCDMIFPTPPQNDPSSE